jgi:hypothetical protein
MLEVQKYLRSGKTVEDLERDFSIKTKPHIHYPNLLGFKYNQIASPFGEKIVQECRGLILDSENNWKIIFHPFHKFFNFGEGHAPEIDWESAVCYEKYDGTFIGLYDYLGTIQVCTLGDPAASGSVNNLDFRGSWFINGKRNFLPRNFAEYFLQIFTTYGLNSFPSNMCFFFELTGPLNRIVVIHDEPSITLLGGRDLETGQEITPVDAGWFFKGIPVAKEYPFKDIASMTDSFADKSPLSHEGYVVVDKYFNRIKIKSPAYVALHHMSSKLSFDKNILKIVRSGEISEVLVAFPEMKNRVKSFKDKYESLISILEKEYNNIKDIPVQKDFALKVVKTKCPSALFQLRAGKTKSIREFLRNCDIKKLMQLLNIEGKENETI